MFEADVAWACTFVAEEHTWVADHSACIVTAEECPSVAVAAIEAAAAHIVASLIAAFEFLSLKKLLIQFLSNLLL